MHRFLSLLAVGLSLVFAHAPARAQAPEVTLTRMDCGTGGPPGDMNLRFSDTFSLVGLKMSLVYSCYLIKHGNDYMVWDSGHSMHAGARAHACGEVAQELHVRFALLLEVIEVVLGVAVAMGYLAPGDAEVGTMVDVNIRDQAVPAEVVAMPFYRRTSG